MSSPAQAPAEHLAIVVATRIALALAAAAGVAVLAAPGFVVELFVSNPDPEAEETAIVVVGGAGATASVIVISWMLIARREEALFLRATAVGSSLVVASGLAVVLLPWDAKALAMGLAFLAAHLITAVLLLRGAAGAFPTSGRTLNLTTGAALAAGGVGVVGSQIPATRDVLAVAMAAFATMAAISALLSRTGGATPDRRARAA
jgi:hypothetical protein